MSKATRDTFMRQNRPPPKKVKAGRGDNRNLVRRKAVDAYMRMVLANGWIGKGKPNDDGKDR